MFFPSIYLCTHQPSYKNRPRSSSIISSTISTKLSVATQQGGEDHGDRLSTQIRSDDSEHDMLYSFFSS